MAHPVREEFQQAVQKQMAKPQHPPASCLGRSSLCPVIKMAWVQVCSQTTHWIRQEVPQEYGIETSKPKKERLMSVQILLSMKSHILTGNLWHLVSLSIGNIKGKHCKYWHISAKLKPGLEPKVTWLIYSPSNVILCISFKYCLNFCRYTIVDEKTAISFQDGKGLWENDICSFTNIFSFNIFILNFLFWYISLMLSQKSTA